MSPSEKNVSQSTDSNYDLRRWRPLEKPEGCLEFSLKTMLCSYPTTETGIDLCGKRNKCHGGEPVGAEYLHEVSGDSLVA